MFLVSPENMEDFGKTSSLQEHPKSSLQVVLFMGLRLFLTIFFFFDHRNHFSAHLVVFLPVCSWTQPHKHCHLSSFCSLFFFLCHQYKLLFVQGRFPPPLYFYQFPLIESSVILTSFSRKYICSPIKPTFTS